MNTVWSVTYTYCGETRMTLHTGDFTNTADVRRTLHPSIVSKHPMIEFVGFEA